MGAGLYRTEPVFRAEIDRCAENLLPFLDGTDLREILYPTEGHEADAAARLGQTRFTQPALFTFGYALARLWMSWGVQPAAMLGHSVGEYVAACLAGVFSLEDALRLVAERARLVQAQPGGVMLAVRLPEKDLLPLTANAGLEIAAINSPGLCVVSGPAEAVAVFEKELETRRVAVRRLKTSHAFHSAMMEPVVEPFAALLREMTLRSARDPVRLERHRTLDHGRAEADRSATTGRAICARRCVLPTARRNCCAPTPVTSCWKRVPDKHSLRWRGRFRRRTAGRFCLPCKRTATIRKPS